MRLWVRDQGRPTPPEVSAPALSMGRASGRSPSTCSLYQHLPYDRLAEIFADVLGIPVSVGAITSDGCPGRRRPSGCSSRDVTDLLCDAPAVHFDETGACVEGSLALGPCGLER